MTASDYAVALHSDLFIKLIELFPKYFILGEFLAVKFNFCFNILSIAIEFGNMEILVILCKLC